MMVIKHYLETLLWVSANISIAYFSAKIIIQYFSQIITKKKISIFLLIGSGILLTAGIGKMGWSIQTGPGTSPNEILNQSIFVIFSHIGSYILFTDLFIKYLHEK